MRKWLLISFLGHSASPRTAIATSTPPTPFFVAFSADVTACVDRPTLRFRGTAARPPVEPDEPGQPDDPVDTC